MCDKVYAEQYNKFGNTWKDMADKLFLQDSAYRSTNYQALSNSYTPFVAIKFYRVRVLLLTWERLNAALRDYPPSSLFK